MLQPMQEGVDSQRTQRRGAGTLARRYALQVGAISVVLLSLAGLVEGAFSYRQARAQMAQLQAVQANAAAREIEQYLRTVAGSVQQVQALPWGTPGFGPEQRREELHRLLALSPAIVSIGDHDAQGRERLFVSRNQLDRVGSGQPWPARFARDRPGFGSAFFDEQGVPNVVLISQLGTGGSQGAGSADRTWAVVNLRFLADVVSGLRLPDEGQIYIVDESARLLAHPDPTFALRQASLAEHPPVRAAQRAFAASQPLLEATDGVGLKGGDSITSAVPMHQPPWQVFVEQPRAKALAPALATLERTLLLLAVGGGVALVVSLISARRMAAPIARLREATAGLAAGQLGTQLQVHSGDEIELLANDFNAMSTRLEQSYKVLEDKVDERTASLKLSTAEAERANADKGRFLRWVSHDLRQPLHAVGLLSGMLRERLADGDRTRVAHDLQQTVQAMDRMFNGLLQLSNLEAGGVTPRPVRFALQDVLHTAFHAHAPQARARGLVLRVRATTETVYTDPTLLGQIVANFCSNAIRYTREGGVLLACRRRGGEVVVQVYDTGVGIAEGQLQAIWGEWVRLPQAHAETGGPGIGPGGGRGIDLGTSLGIGLDIVKRSAELLGLRIAVVSRPGRGSRFEVILPALPVAEAGTLVDAFVLLVDDNAQSLEATALALRQAGSLVATAASADAALAELAQHLRAPDAIVVALDHAGAPDAPGGALGLVQRLRDEVGAAVPALVVTAGLHWQGGALPGVQVLQGPVPPLQLLEALARGLPNGGPGAA